MRNNLRRIAPEEPVTIILPASRQIGIIHIDSRYPCPAMPSQIDIPCSWIDLRRGTNDENQVDRFIFSEILVNSVKDSERKLFAEPDHAGAEKVCLASRALREIVGFQFGEMDVDVADVKI